MLQGDVLCLYKLENNDLVGVFILQSLKYMAFFSLSPEHGQQRYTPTLNCSALLAAIWQNLTNIP